MLTREDDIDVHALRRQGLTITAIARHLGIDRKTIRTYLAGDRQTGVRAHTVAGPFEVFAPYCAQRLGDDPHLAGDRRRQVLCLTHLRKAPRAPYRAEVFLRRCAHPH